MRRWIEVRPVEAEDGEADLYAPMPRWAIVAMALGFIVLAVPYAFYVVG